MLDVLLMQEHYVLESLFKNRLFHGLLNTKISITSNMLEYLFVMKLVNGKFLKPNKNIIFQEEHLFLIIRHLLFLMKQELEELI